ncbi:MAG: hypothetical protein IJE58_09775 [Oscillospiraceae bacterium]|nr:hypothetical protein [Oscillospiraceae bacterium]
MNQQNNRNGKLLWLLPAAVLAVVAAVLLTREPKAPPAAEPMPTVTIRDSAELSLGQGLVIERLDGYSGVYMEDGSDDIVQDVMMMLLRNDSDRCLQLARIDVTCGGGTAVFEVTDLPAGSRAVLLERSRRVYNGESVQLAQARDVVFFEESVDPAPETLELQGEEGRITVTNRTGAAIAGPVCIYYKNSAADVYYGGITYRVTISQGLAAGETVTVPAGHYDPASCSFIRAHWGE